LDILIGAEKMGYWAKNICGSSYLFSNTLASFSLQGINFGFIEVMMTGYMGSKLSKMLQHGFDAHSV
jgi:hypothetical protein